MNQKNELKFKYSYDGPCICNTDKDDGECMQCAQKVCIHGDPLHWHHDGCPSCYIHESELEIIDNFASFMGVPGELYK